MICSQAWSKLVFRMIASNSDFASWDNESIGKFHNGIIYVTEHSIHSLASFYCFFLHLGIKTSCSWQTREPGCFWLGGPMSQCTQRIWVSCETSSNRSGLSWFLPYMRRAVPHLSSLAGDSAMQGLTSHSPDPLQLCWGCLCVSAGCCVEHFWAAGVRAIFGKTPTAGCSRSFRV